jgi:hypothetical protein
MTKVAERFSPVVAPPQRRWTISDPQTLEGHGSPGRHAPSTMNVGSRSHDPPPTSTATRSRLLVKHPWRRGHRHRRVQSHCSRVHAPQIDHHPLLRPLSSLSHQNDIPPPGEAATVGLATTLS